MKIKFIIFSALPLLAGFIGSYFTLPSIGTWYLALNKPFFNPPNFIFGPVWTLLYILIGISLYLVLTKKGKKEKALKLFTLQLILNVLWSLIFFGFHNPILALVEIVILWISIFVTIKSFLPISKNAAYLLYPYIVWVSFALILNISIVLLNP